MSQRFHLDYLETVLQTALQGCRNIQTVLDEVVRRYVEQAISIWQPSGPNETRHEKIRHRIAYGQWNYIANWVLTHE